MTADDPILIRTGLPPLLRTRAAELYWDAFGAKLGPLLGTRRRAVRAIAGTLALDHAVVALRGDELLGVAGFHVGSRGFIDLDGKAFRTVYGPVGGWVRRALLHLLLGRAAESGELVMDGIAVREDARGQGIGTRLLDEVERVAVRLGKNRIRLDVVDTNPDARRLYERRGFVATRTEDLPLLRSVLGFGAATTMVKRVQTPRLHDPA